MKTWEERHNAKKEEVGMAEPGSVEYDRNAAEVLAVHAGPGMRPETRAKLEALADSDDPEARRVAARALQESAPAEEDLQYDPLDYED